MSDSGTSIVIYTKKQNIHKTKQEIIAAQMQTTVCFQCLAPTKDSLLVWIKPNLLMKTQAESQSGDYIAHQQVWRRLE